MKEINDLIINPLPSEPTNKPEPSGPSVRQKRLVSAFWQKMTRLFKHQWVKAEGEILTKGLYSDGFLEWCAETEHLTNEEWARGVQAIKDEFKKNKAAGDDTWPPNYIEFVVNTEETDLAKYNEWLYQEDEIELNDE